MGSFCWSHADRTTKDEASRAWNEWIDALALPPRRQPGTVPSSPHPPLPKSLQEETQHPHLAHLRVEIGAVLFFFPTLLLFPLMLLWCSACYVPYPWHAPSGYAYRPVCWARLVTRREARNPRSSTFHLSSLPAHKAGMLVEFVCIFVPLAFSILA